MRRKQNAEAPSGIGLPGRSDRGAELGAQVGLVAPDDVTREWLAAHGAPGVEIAPWHSDAGSAAVYSCGPPQMLETVGTLCAEAGVACELAMESPMACGYGACFGCAVPKPGGGYLRLCVDGPVLRPDQIGLAHA